MQLKVIEFTYTKNDKTVSYRQCVIVDEPSDSYLGLEIHGGDMTPINSYLDYLAEVEELKKKYNFTGLPFKRFKVEKMTNVDVQTVNLATSWKIA